MSTITAEFSHRVEAAKNSLHDKTQARREERERTRALIAQFEAHLEALDKTPPEGLSDAKIAANREAVERTLSELRRQIAPPKPLRRMPGY